VSSFGDTRDRRSKTWGVSGSYLSFSDASYRNLTGIFRYYPRAAMSGFYIGGRLGVHRIGNDFGSGTFLGAGATSDTAGRSARSRTSALGWVSARCACSATCRACRSRFQR